VSFRIRESRSWTIDWCCRWTLHTGVRPIEEADCICRAVVETMGRRLKVVVRCSLGTYRREIGGTYSKARLMTCGKTGSTRRRLPRPTSRLLRTDDRHAPPAANGWVLHRLDCCSWEKVLLPLITGGHEEGPVGVELATPNPALHRRAMASEGCARSSWAMISKPRPGAMGVSDSLSDHAPSEGSQRRPPPISRYTNDPIPSRSPGPVKPDGPRARDYGLNWPSGCGSFPELCVTASTGVGGRPNGSAHWESENSESRWEMNV